MQSQYARFDLAIAGRARPGKSGIVWCFICAYREICGTIPPPMSPVTHLFCGWVLASAFPIGEPTSLARREKALVVAAAVVPDLDGAGIIPELLTRNSSHPLLWFSQYHHSLHTLAFALVCTFTAYLIAGPFANFTFGPMIQGRRLPTHPRLTALLVFLSFHLHLLCDLVGARGPDGYQWPIPYLRPFSSAWQLTWHGQWALNGWQNFVLTTVLLGATFWIAWKYGSSPLELVSGKVNRAFVQALRMRGPSNRKKAHTG
jgi:LexA-binding, inner membrane-associated putative hydrolase